MKHKKVIQVIAENYEEEQYMLNKFPEAWWIASQVRGKTTFTLPLAKEDLVHKAINEYKELKRK